MLAPATASTALFEIVLYVMLLVRSQCRARTIIARYHGYGAYFTFLWHNAFYNVLPDPSLGLGLARETTCKVLYTVFFRRVAASDLANVAVVT